MKTNEFDSSDEEDAGEEETSPLLISWLSLNVVECSGSIGICSLPGCRYKENRRNLRKDVDELCVQGVEDVFVFCSRGELALYRVPSLLEVYSQQGLRVHHLPIPDGGTPELSQCSCILEELQDCLQNQRRTVIHCYGGLGRSGLIAACLLLRLSVSMTPSEALEVVRNLRGARAVQTVKQYNFIHEFREKFEAYQETKVAQTGRSVSR